MFTLKIGMKPLFINFPNAFIMKKTILFFASVLMIFQGFSQKGFNTTTGGSSGAANSNYDLYLRTIEVDEKATSFGLGEDEFKAIKNDIYVDSNFKVGDIFQDENLIKAKIPMRYNAYADEIEIKNHASEENYGALIKDPSIHVTIDKDNYVFAQYEGSNEKGGYFNILVDGKTYDLYKKTVAVYKEPKKAKTSYDQDTPASFEMTTKYYLVQDDQFIELPKKKTKVLQALKLDTVEVMNYIKENKLDPDKEPDLIKIVAYFDSLS